MNFRFQDWKYGKTLKTIKQIKSGIKYVRKDEVLLKGTSWI